MAAHLKLVCTMDSALTVAARIQGPFVFGIWNSNIGHMAQQHVLSQGSLVSHDDYQKLPIGAYEDFFVEVGKIIV